MNSKILFLKVAAIVILIASISCQKENSLKLVQNGHSDFVIVTDEDASETISLAASELQKYIETISSVRIPVLKGEINDATKSLIRIESRSDDSHGIEIKADGKNLLIRGGTEQGTLYAVYEFLDRYLNCKWYAPGVEEIPSSEIISISGDLSYAYAPEIETRTVHSRLFYEDPGFAARHKVTSESFPYYVPTARVHTFHRFVPEEKYYKDHPEYFALRGGKRLPTQLCLTNPDVMRIVKDSVASFFEQYPDSKVISVSQNDNQQYCEDENCKRIDEMEGGPTGTMIHFVNEIAAQFPDKVISTLAYQYTRKPSKTPPAENVMITLCSIECDRSGPIEEKCEEFAADLKGWNKISDRIRIWDYTTQFTNFLAPFPNIHTLQPNIKFFRDHSAKWVFEQHSNNPSELFELRSYVTAKLLWEPDRNTDELITEFTDGYYGAAGPFVKMYLDQIHQEIKKDEDFFLFLYGDPSQAFDSFLSKDLLKAYDDIFNQAEAAVSNDAELLSRVKMARIGVDYAILEAGRKSISEKYSLTTYNGTGQKSVNPFVIDKLDNFSNTTGQAGIVLMNEMGYTVEEYVSNYRMAFKVALKPNKAVGKAVVLHTKPKKYANEDPQVLTDGSLGGNSFYSNWLGFEGNDMEAVIDLGEVQEVESVSTAFLQVTNHVVFFPTVVQYSYSTDNKTFTNLGRIKNNRPLTKKSKVNEISYFDLKFDKVKARYIKIVGRNMKEPPYWHHAAGTPSWIFADEVIIN
jgi:hypothetical protein